MRSLEESTPEIAQGGFSMRLRRSRKVHQEKKTLHKTNWMHFQEHLNKGSPTPGPLLCRELFTTGSRRWRANACASHLRGQRESMRPLVQMELRPLVSCSWGTISFPPPPVCKAGTVGELWSKPYFFNWVLDNNIRQDGLSEKNGESWVRSIWEAPGWRILPKTISEYWTGDAKESEHTCCCTAWTSSAMRPSDSKSFATLLMSFRRDSFAFRSCVEDKMLNGWEFSEWEISQPQNKRRWAHLTEELRLSRMREPMNNVIS